MKNFTHPIPALVLVGFLVFGYTTQTIAQCNVNDKYDKIISGYHSSIALKDNGTYAVWGQALQKDGATDQLTPQDINSTNYTGLTGTILKAALGGGKGGGKDQAVLLTTDGLWAWGPETYVLSTTLTGSSTFARITSPTGATALGLPSGVTPSDVQSLFATYQTLVIVTKIVGGTGGNVWVLTQTTLAVEGNGGTYNTAGTSTWQKVKTGAGTDLTNVTSARGQVSTATYNAFIAQTSSGAVYTWGNSTYLGNASVSAYRTYATQMTLPQESGSNIVPKMIGVTGGTGTTSTTKNTYYILSTTGNLYALGDNTQKQCGDFTTTERKSWIQVQKSNTAGDYLTNINTFSCQEHSASFPAIGVINTTGVVYTWGNDDSGMLGRTDNGTAGGTVGTSYDPGTTVDFTGTAVSIEMGGHTMLYIKTGSSQFCYVGHFTNGSMGAGSGSATVISPNCATTPNISICGYVPVAPSASTSTISAAQTSIAANGTSTTTITIQLKDASGINLTSSGGVVIVNTSAGTVGTVIDNNDGTYTVILTSAAAPASATISYSINGTAASNTAIVVFNSTLAVRWGNIFAFRQNHNLKIQWSTTQENNVSHYDVERSSNGRDWNIAIPFIPANNLTTAYTYLQTDNDYTSERVYYRVKQTDMSGRYTYSAVVTVAADNGIEKLVIYPVPVQNTFQMSNINPKDIKKVELITINGSYVRTWFSAQSSYDISNISKGMYIIKITTTDDSAVFSKLTKQ
jgi:alpha-tubulin suppressor-like RCC1 family protein